MKIIRLSRIISAVFRNLQAKNAVRRRIQHRKETIMTDTINMKRALRHGKVQYVLWIALAEAVGALAGWVTRAGAQYFNTDHVHPPLTAPSWVFPIAWAILYALMGIGAARVYMAADSTSRRRALSVFLVQLVFNFFWPIIFFNAEAYGLAFAWIIALFAISVAMMIAFRRIDDTAGMLQIPYLVWLAYAAYINAGVWIIGMR